MKAASLLMGFFLLWICPLSMAETGTAEHAVKAAPKPLKANVTLIAIPIRAKSIMAGGTVNALEKPAAEMPPVWTSVLFRVERIMSGEFKVPKGQELSLWDNVKDAADDKNILKLLTMDFEKPDEDGTDKGWLSMAVVDPYASFGVREGEDPAVRQRYKLSLARVHKDPDSFVLVKSEKL
jgi:hypothetical protein